MTIWGEATLLALLRDAALRKVKVRLLLDGLTASHIPAPLIAALVSAGVQIKVYHPIKIRYLMQISRRMHDKYLSVDGRHVALGDRNIGGGYFGSRNSPKAVTRSQEVLVSGPTVAKVDTYFEKMWADREVETLQYSESTPFLISTANTRMTDAAVAARLQLGMNIELKDILARGTDVGEVTFITDEIEYKRRWSLSAPSLDPNGNTAAMIKLINEAKTELVLVNPYVVLTREVKAAIRAARARGVRIVLITNSAATAGPLTPQYVFEFEKAWLLNMGVEIYQYWRAFELHTKMVIADREKIYIGACNLDPRSQTQNLETGVVYSSIPMALELLNGIEDDMERYMFRVNPPAGPRRPSNRIECFLGATLCLFRSTL